MPERARYAEEPEVTALPFARGTHARLRPGGAGIVELPAGGPAIQQKDHNAAAADLTEKRCPASAPDVLPARHPACSGTAAKNTGARVINRA